MSGVASRSKASIGVQRVLAIDSHASSLAEDYPVAYPSVIGRCLTSIFIELQAPGLLTYADNSRQDLIAYFLRKLRHIFEERGQYITMSSDLVCPP